MVAAASTLLFKRSLSFPNLLDHAAQVVQEAPQEQQEAAKEGASTETPDTPHLKTKDIYYWEPKSLRIRAINWAHVFSSEYANFIYHFALFILGGVLLWRLWTTQFQAVYVGLQTLISDPGARETVAVAAFAIAYLMRLKPNVYCMENVVFVPPTSWQVTHQELMNMMKAQDCFTDKSMEFLGRMLDRSGTGDSTHWPPGILISKDGTTKANTDVASAREEAQQVLFPIVRDIFEKTGVKPKDIDFLVVNCSIFTPTPSICAMICNEFHLRQDVRSYNLGGMGCSANVISVDLARQLLENQPGSRALVISTENLTQNLYTGNDKSMLLQNTLFRAGGVAILLSSRRCDALKAKYKLLYTSRTMISDDNSHRCVYEQQDELGNRGVALSKDIVKVAGNALFKNLVEVGPHVLPIREQLKVVVNRSSVALMTKFKKAGLTNLSPPKFYTPNFCKGIDHFCIHAGGRAVIEGVQKNLSLKEHHVRPSVETLREWGNTSSSSIWYELEWIERFGNLKRGDRVLQIAFGSGFKCNSAVWVALHVDKKKRDQPLKQSGKSCDPDFNFSVVNKAL